MTARSRGRAGLALALAGTSLALLDIGGGLLVAGGYTLRTVFVHVVVVLVGAAGVLAAAWPGVAERRPSLLTAACALLIGAQAPWTTEGLIGRPWFALAGVAATMFLVASVAVLAGFDLGPARAAAVEGAERFRMRRDRRRQSRRRRPRGQATADAPDVRPGTGPTAPGWYPDPDAEALPCWRWWDGRDWTEHRSSGAAG